GAAERAARASVTRTCASALPGFATARYSWTEVPLATTAKENVLPRLAVQGVLLAARWTPRAPTRRMRRSAVMRAAEDTTAAAILSGPMSALTDSRRGPWGRIVRFETTVLPSMIRKVMVTVT